MTTSATLTFWAPSARSPAALPAAVESRSFSSTQRVRASMAAVNLGRRAFLSSSMASCSWRCRESSSAFCSPDTYSSMLELYAWNAARSSGEEMSFS